MKPGTESIDIGRFKRGGKSSDLKAQSILKSLALDVAGFAKSEQEAIFNIPGIAAIKAVVNVELFGVIGTAVAAFPPVAGKDFIALGSPARIAKFLRIRGCHFGREGVPRVMGTARLVPCCANCCRLAVAVVGDRVVVLQALWLFSFLVSKSLSKSARLFRLASVWFYGTMVGPARAWLCRLLKSFSAYAAHCTHTAT